MLLWLLSSQMDNRIPYDLHFITRKLGSTSSVDVEELILQGFIEVSQDDGKPLASRKQMPIVETETEAYTKETEKRQNTSSTKKGRGKAAPWMGLVIQAWKLTYPGAKPPAGTANALRPLFARMGEDAAILELKDYLAKTPSTYLNLGKFAATAGIEGPATKTNGYHPMTSADKQDLILQEAIRQRDAKLIHA